MKKWCGSHGGGRQINLPCADLVSAWVLIQRIGKQRARRGYIAREKDAPSEASVFT